MNRDRWNACDTRFVYNKCSALTLRPLEIIELKNISALRDGAIIVSRTMGKTGGHIMLSMGPLTDSLPVKYVPRISEARMGGCTRYVSVRIANRPACAVKSDFDLLPIRLSTSHLIIKVGGRERVAKMFRKKR